MSSKDNNENVIDTLFNKVDAYGSTKYELFKLRTVDKTADLSARLLAAALILVALSSFGLFINLSLSHWIGDLLGETYFGYAVVAGFYGLIGLLLYLTRRKLAKRLKNYVISQLLN